MTSGFRPLLEVLRELRSLTLKKASGYFFVVTEDNHSCMIRVHGGLVENVVFRIHRNDAAVQRLAMVGSARARFQADPVSGSGAAVSALSPASQQWLLGGFEQDLGVAPAVPVPTMAAPAQAATPPAQGTGAVQALMPDERQRQTIEQTALRYFGPIAGMLCDEVFDAPGDLQQQLGRLAANLASPDETRRFLKDVREALGLPPA